MSKMNKRIAVLSTAAVAALVTSIIFAVGVLATPGTLWVHPTNTIGSGSCASPDYNSINAALAAASAGDTIRVCSGTYNQSIEFGATFTTDDLTVSGDMTDRPVITGGVRFLNGNTYDIDGLTIEYLYIKGVASGGNGVFDMDNGGNVTNFTLDHSVIDGEKFSGDDPYRHGFLGQNLGMDFTITNSEFKDILGWAVMDSGSGSSGDGALHFHTVTFSNNYIHDNDGSMAIRGLSTDRTHFVNVIGNTWNNIGGNDPVDGIDFHWAAFEVNRAVTVTIQNNIVNDVILGDGGKGQAFQLWDIDTLDLSGNTITNNFEGIFIYGDAGGVLGGPFPMPSGSISYNCIMGNTQYGLNGEPTTGVPLDAENNWWNAPTGPSGDGGGKGDAVISTVSGDVDFDPWLKSLADTCKGFVSGGGSVDSPAGADADNPATVGPATFSFISKYQKGKTSPTGNLMFQFKAGDLRFTSTSMDWLVVTGQPRAQFRGEGSISGGPVCKFQVDAWDGSFSASNVDAFGIKLYACASGTSDRYSLDATPLAKGSVVIHKK